MTPTDIIHAIELKQTHLKFFPAGTIGGPSALKAISAPYAQFGLKFCPTGGINPKNMQDFLKLNNVFAVGGSWLATAEQINNAQWKTITNTSKEALNTFNPN